MTAPADTAVHELVPPAAVPDEVDLEVVKLMEASIDWGPYPRGGWAQFEGLRTRWDWLDCEDLPVIYPNDEGAEDEKRLEPRHEAAAPLVSIRPLDVAR